jgi:hypothetical protein
MSRLRPQEYHYMPVHCLAGQVAPVMTFEALLIMMLLVSAIKTFIAQRFSRHNTFAKAASLIL